MNSFLFLESSLFRCFPLFPHSLAIKQAELPVPTGLFPRYLRRPEAGWLNVPLGQGRHVDSLCPCPAKLLIAVLPISKSRNPRQNYGNDLVSRRRPWSGLRYKPLKVVALASCRTSLSTHEASYVLFHISDQITSLHGTTAPLGT